MFRSDDDKFTPRIDTLSRNTHHAIHLTNGTNFETNAVNVPSDFGTVFSNPTPEKQKPPRTHQNDVENRTALLGNERTTKNRDDDVDIDVEDM